jgi:hypothetical protein
MIKSSQRVSRLAEEDKAGPLNMPNELFVAMFI